jgi:hypothetical protein
MVPERSVIDRNFITSPNNNVQSNCETWDRERDSARMKHLNPHLRIGYSNVFFFFFEPILFWNTSPRLSPVVTTSRYICEKK